MIRTCAGGARLFEQGPRSSIRYLSTSRDCWATRTKSCSGMPTFHNPNGLSPEPWNQYISRARLLNAAPRCIRSFSASSKDCEELRKTTSTKTTVVKTTPAAVEVVEEVVEEVAEAARYRFHTVASYSPKGAQYQPEKEIWTFDPERAQDFAPAKRKLRSDAGQDAFFVAGLKSVVGGSSGEGAVAVGVADGVGGFDANGIDSAYFSQGLCIRMASAAHASPSEDVSPKDLMAAGYLQLIEEARVRGGASTACVGVYKPDGHLTVANLGDSGFVILRNGKVLYASEAQTHSFNCPLQLTMIPKRIIRQFALHGGRPLFDTPDDSFVSSHTLLDGDVIIFATDGVWDNASNQDILRVVSEKMLAARAWQIGKKGGIQPLPAFCTVAVAAEIAKAVVAKAKSASTNSKVDGPFAKEVQRLFPGESYHGGKIDDICVVATVVVREEQQTTS